MKRLLAVLLCLSLLLGSVTALAKGFSGSVERSNVTDTEGPDIIKFVFTENKKTLKPGDILHVKMKLDDRSDITAVNMQFYNKQEEAYISLLLEYNAASDMYEGSVPLFNFNPDGTYVINWFQATDQYGNSAGKWHEGKGYGSFTLKGSGASKTVKGTVKIKENGKTVKPSTEIHVEVKLQKANAKADHLFAYLGPADTSSYSDMFALIKKSPTVYEGVFSFTKDHTNGKYSIKTVELQDEYDDILGVIHVTGQSVTLTGARAAVSSKSVPTISSAALKEKNKTLTSGDTVHISAKIKSKTPIDAVYGNIEDLDNSFYPDESSPDSFITKSKKQLDTELKYNASSGKWEGSITLPKEMADGKYCIYIYLFDEASHFAYKRYDKLTFTYKSPDYVDALKENFVCECWNAIWNKDPGAAEIQQYGMPLATGKQKAVNVIQALMKKAGLSGEAAAEALWQIMQGKSPSAAEKDKTVAALKTGLDYAIDSLNNAVFRQRCKDWGIKPGNLGTKAADTQVASVDVDGGHYTLNGSKATLTSITDKNIKKLVVKDTVKANGKTYKVIAIDGTACKGLAKLTTLTIGKNVTSIGPEAFKNCKKLKTITVNATNLKKVGANAFTGIKNKATFKCPKKKLSKYEKLIREKGNAPKKAKFK